DSGRADQGTAAGTAALAGAAEQVVSAFRQGHGGVPGLRGASPIPVWQAPPHPARCKDCQAGSEPGRLRAAPSQPPPTRGGLPRRDPLSGTPSRARVAPKRTQASRARRVPDKGQPVLPRRELPEPARAEGSPFRDGDLLSALFLTLPRQNRARASS